MAIQIAVVALAQNPASTRERLIEAAREIFYVQGYDATSVAEMLERAEVHSGSLYHLFESKQHLLLAVLDQYKELLKPILIDPILQKEADPIERIFALLNGYREGLIHTVFTGGCPIGNLGLEVGDHIPEARRLVAENFDGWCGWIEAWLDEAGNRLPGSIDRNQLAQFILTVMEGGVMQARAHGSIDPFDASVNQLRTYIGMLEKSSDQRVEDGKN